MASNPMISRRGAQKYLKNPFIPDASSNSKIGPKRLKNKSGDKFMVVNTSSSEVVASVGFHEIMEVDKTQFIKLFINGVKAFQGLKNAGAKVFELIYRATMDSPGTDTIRLSYHEIDQEITPISRPTYDRGMTELINMGFIAESTIPGKYFLNIDYLFNGDRLAFIREFRLKSSKPVMSEQQILEERGQQRLIVDDEQ